jgi:hypothetical protein
MNNIPVFPVNSARGCYEQLLAFSPDPATGKPDPAKIKAFLAAHPEAARAGLDQETPGHFRFRKRHLQRPRHALYAHAYHAAGRLGVLSAARYRSCSTALCGYRRSCRMI